MMPNVVRGDRMAGLMTYLVGAGRANEHTEPHLVAGDDAMMAWYDDAELSGQSAVEIARHLDRPRRAFGVDVDGGHVWHCSLSLRALEGAQTDQRWAEIASDFIAAMEFDDNQGTKAPCRWVAVRHGVSKNGNDHIHLVVNLVREDGTKASTHHDFRRAQVAARALETKYGLEELESATVERSTRGYHPAEREAQARSRARAKVERDRTRGADVPAWEQLPADQRQARIAAEMRADQPRHLLALKVRGCAAASRSEAEYVRRLRREGLIVRPRFAYRRTDVVTGYSVAERPQAGERPIWYGGGNLGRDLTLPRLRDGWEDTPTAASDAAAEWRAAKRGRRVVAPGREVQDVQPGQWNRQSDRVATMVEQLRAVPIEDRSTWATVARQTSGALAAWSNAIEPVPGEIASAAEALSRSAQTFRPTVRPDKAKTIALSGAAFVLASAARGGKGPVAQAAMVRQLIMLTESVTRAARAAGDERHAREVLTDAQDRLERVHRGLTAGAGAPTSTAAVPVAVERDVPLDPDVQQVLDQMRAGQAHEATRATRIVPAKVEPATQQQAVRPGAERGPER